MDKCHFHHLFVLNTSIVVSGTRILAHTLRVLSTLFLPCTAGDQKLATIRRNAFSPQEGLPIHQMRPHRRLQEQWGEALQ